MRRMICRTISLSGLEVADFVEAGDGIEALEILNREWVDVILADINMPRMNGEERRSTQMAKRSFRVARTHTDGRGHVSIRGHIPS